MKRIVWSVLSAAPVVLGALACTNEASSPPAPAMPQEAPASTVAQQLTAQGFVLDEARPAQKMTVQGRTVTGTPYTNPDGRAALLLVDDASSEEHGVIFDPHTGKQLEQLAPKEVESATGSSKPLVWPFTDCLGACEWEYFGCLFLQPYGTTFDICGDLVEGCYMGCGS